MIAIKYVKLGVWCILFLCVRVACRQTYRTLKIIAQLQKFVLPSNSIREKLAN